VGQSRRQDRRSDELPAYSPAGGGTIFGIRDGLKDARLGRPAYFWTIFSDRTQRSELLHEGWKAVMKVFIMAVVIDAVYQYLQLAWFYPGEALIVAFILAFIPYLLIRGPINRIARKTMTHRERV
jgi:hypothetical protein